MFSEGEKNILLKRQPKLEVFELDRDKTYMFFQHVDQARGWDLNGFSGKDARVGRVVPPIQGVSALLGDGAHDVYMRVYAETDDGSYLWVGNGKVDAVVSGGFAAGLLRKTAVAAGVRGVPHEGVTWVAGLQEVVDAVGLQAILATVESAMPEKGFVLLDFTSSESSHRLPGGVLIVAPEGYLHHRKDRHSEYRG